MTVKEFAAFTGMSKPQVRDALRTGALAGIKRPAETVDGKRVNEHYEITEDPAQWLKKRNTKPAEPMSEVKNPSPHQSPQGQEPETKATNGTMVIAGLSLLALATFAGLLWYESARNY